MNARLLMLVAAGFYSLGSCAAKMASAHVGSTQVALFQWVCILVVCSGVAGCTRQWPVLNRWLMLRGLAGALAITCLYGGLSLIPLGDAMAIFSIYPVWASLLAHRFLDEPLSPQLLGCSLCCVAGTTLVALGERREGPAEALGYAVELLGSFFAALEFLTCRMLTGTNPLALSASVALFGALVSSVLVLVDPAAKPIASVAPVGWAVLVAVALTGFVAVTCVNSAAQRLPAGVVSVIGVSEVVFAYALQVAVFDEAPGLAAVGGSGLILASVMGVARLNAPAEASERASVMGVAPSHELSACVGDAAATGLA